MAGSIRGITIELNGDTSGLVKSLKAVDSAVKSTKTQLKDVDKLLKLNPGNTELLTQKQRLLSSEIQATKNKLQELNKAQAEMDAQGMDKTSEQYMALQREIIATQGDLERLEGELSDFGSVGAQKIAALGDKISGIGKKLSDIGGTLSKKVTAPIVAGFTLAAKSASDYEENLNKIDVAFGDSAEAVKTWAETALEQFGLSKVAATEAVSSFGALGKGIGLAEKDAAEMATTLAGLSADLASYFNTSTDVSAKALEGIFTGEAEALKKFGVVMNDTNLKQFAADQGLVYDKLSQTEKTMLRYNYVLAKTADAQGDYARTSDGTANSVKTFQAALSDVATVIGTELLPLITPLITKLGKVITQVSKMPPKTRKVVVTLGLIAAGIGPLLVGIGKVASGAGALMKLAPKLVSAFSVFGVKGLVVAAIIAAVVLIIKNWDKIKAAGKALASALAQTWQSIRSTITNTATAIRDGVTQAWESLKQRVTQTTAAIQAALSTAWNTIKTTATTAWTAIKTAVTTTFTNLGTSLSTIAGNIRTALSNAWNAIKTAASTAWNAIKTTVSTAFSNLSTALSATAASIKSALATAWDTIKTKATTTWTTIKTSVSSTFTTLKESLSGTVDALKTSLSTAWNTIRTTAAGAWGKIKSAITAPISSAKSTIEGYISSIKTALGNIVIPKFSLTMGTKILNLGILGRRTIPWPNLDIGTTTVGALLGFAKAMNNAYILDGAQIFGMMGNRPMMGGEAGKEIIMSYDKLAKMMGGGGGTTINVTVNPAPGMDERALADMVARRIQRSVENRRAVWA